MVVALWMWGVVAVVVAVWMRGVVVVVVAVRGSMEDRQREGVGDTVAVWQ